MIEPLGIALEIGNKRRALAARLSPQARTLAFPNEYRARLFKPVAPIASVTAGVEVIKEAPTPKPVVREPALMIVDVCAARWGVTSEDILGRRQPNIFVRPRQASMVLIRRHLGMSLPQIGKLYRRDHTTAMHALVRHEYQLEIDADYSARFAAAAGEVRALFATGGNCNEG